MKTEMINEMVALNDEDMSKVNGGCEQLTDEEIHDKSMENAKKEANNVIKFFENIINFFS